MPLPNSYLKMLSIVVIILVAAALLRPQQVQAALSDGCAEVNAEATVISDDWTLVLTSPLAIGEQVTVRFTVASGSPTIAALEIPTHNPVADGSLPATLSHTIRSSGITTIRAGVDTGQAEIDWSCKLAPKGGGEGAAEPPDDRLNFQQCDTAAAVYAETGADGSPELHVYGIYSGGNGQFLFKITQADFAPFQDEGPASNVLIKAYGGAALYMLTSREFQLNLGPDFEGKMCSLVFSGLKFENPHVLTWQGAIAAAAPSDTNIGQSVVISGSICFRACRAGKHGTP